MAIAIEYVDIARIRAYPNNAKKHSAAQINRIAKSIQMFGWKQPIVIDKDGVIVAGHGRFLAAQKLGQTTVPCVITTDLTDDQVRAYRLADNKLNESDWDYKTLDLELPEIEIDMSEFDFDLSLTFEDRHDQYKEDTRGRVLDIVNLGDGQFKGAGPYDIPILAPVTDLPPITEWIGFNYVLSDTAPEGKGVHFFIDDYQFERLWNSPDKYLDKLRRYACVATPDFSPYGDMPHALQIYNHYRKHWVGAWLQTHGVTVIPTIRCSTDPRSLDWYLDGEPQGGIVIISSMWTKDESTAGTAREEYTRMKNTLKPSKIFIYGGRTESMGIEDGDNVEYISNFTQGRWE